MEVLLPKPSIKSKTYNKKVEQQGLQAGLHPIVARVIASRALPEELPLLQALSPKLKNLSLPQNMADMEKAASRVALAVQRGEYIGIETDHDCDGQTSHAVLYHNLIQHFHHPKEKIRSYIGHRLTEGYGLSESVATRILADDPQPTLLITADNGSSDEPRIRKLKEAGIDVIVTDHHEIPLEGIPKSAFACLNPTRPDCAYNDPYIAGCMVAWLLMASTRQILIRDEHLANDTPSLLDSLDFVAVGTIADCVSIARSINNRAVVAYGLRLIEAGTRACWRAIKTLIPATISSEDLAFRVGPLLNSDGRLASAFGSVSFLLADRDEEALNWMSTLQESNTERKLIQHEIVLKGLVAAKDQVKSEKFSLCIYLPEGHSGVHGIAASRIKEIYGRPTAFFAPKVCAPGVITGSVRGVEHFHVRKALQSVADHYPGMLIAFGGHQGAGGLTIKLPDFEAFSEAFEIATQQQLQSEQLGPVIWTEGVLPLQHLNLDLVDALNRLEPFGREFEQPIFEMQANLKDIRFIGDGTHARVQLESDGFQMSGVWFKFRQTPQSPVSVQVNSRVQVAFSVKSNVFRNQRSLDIHIAHMEAI